MCDTTSRRRLLRTLAAGSTAIGLAGCSGGDGGGGDGTVEEWLSGAKGYDGVVARTGSDVVVVDVGTGPDNLAFDPAAVRISPDTTVRWEWTGRGGVHNVVDQGGAFDSGDPKLQPEPFEHTFEEPGTYRYLCEPHSTVGMKGAVVVGSE